MPGKAAVATAEYLQADCYGFGQMPRPAPTPAHPELVVRLAHHERISLRTPEIP